MFCPSCDFCLCNSDGVLTCAIRGEQVHVDSTCDFWQKELNVIDGDNFYEVRTWPKKKKSQGS